MNIIHCYGDVVPIGLCNVDYGSGVRVGYGKEVSKDKKEASTKEKAFMDFIVGVFASVGGSSVSEVDE